MTITKKKLKKIQDISFVMDVLKNNAEFDDWYNFPPETWHPEQTKLFDEITELEDKIKEKVLEILSE